MPEKMAYYHVIAKVGSDAKLRVLFADLSDDDLQARFLKPYEKGTPFFSGNDLISPEELRSVQVILTSRPDEEERSDIHRKSLERIARLNAEGPGPVIISAGAGHRPEDIAEAGEDVTHVVIKGHPGFRAGKWDPSIKVMAWVGGIAASVLAAGIVKWLGWL